MDFLEEQYIYLEGLPWLKLEAEAASETFFFFKKRQERREEKETERTRKEKHKCDSGRRHLWYVTPAHDLSHWQ